MIDATPIKRSSTGYLARLCLGLLALIASVPAFAVDAQAGATTFWSRYITTCGASIVWSEGRKIYEGRGWRINVAPATLTMADKLNGYEWSGETSMDVEAYRVRDGNSPWTEWHDGAGITQHMYVTQLFLKEGAWKSSGPFGLTISPVDCRTLKQADSLAANAQRERESQELNWGIQLAAALQRVWIRPPGIDRNLKAKISLRLSASGEVLAADIRESSGNAEYDSSVVRAGYKASPLPLPRDPSIFQDLIVITFSPRT